MPSKTIGNLMFITYLKKRNASFGGFRHQIFPKAQVATYYSTQHPTPLSDFYFSYSFAWCDSFCPKAFALKTRCCGAFLFAATFAFVNL